MFEIRKHPNPRNINLLHTMLLLRIIRMEEKKSEHSLMEYNYQPFLFLLPPSLSIIKTAIRWEYFFSSSSIETTTHNYHPSYNIQTTKIKTTTFLFSYTSQNYIYIFFIILFFYSIFNLFSI